MAKEKQEYDYEGDMAMSQLKSIIANAQRIHDMLSRDTNIPEWVQSKITLAEDYITTAANYMQGEMSEEVKIGRAYKVPVKSPQPLSGGKVYKEKPVDSKKLDAVSKKIGSIRGMKEEVAHSEHDMHEDMAMGHGPVNVAANVADPQNKKLFTKPMKRFKSFKAK